MDRIVNKIAGLGVPGIMLNALTRSKLDFD